MTTNSPSNSSPSPTDPAGDAPARSAAAPVPAQVYLAPRSTWKSRIMAIALFLAIAALIQQQISLRSYFSRTEGLQEHYFSGDKWASAKIAILRVEGVIMSGEGFVKRQIDQIREDENVRGIVLRVDTPGGTVSGSDYILHHVRKLREDLDVPLIVSMGPSATSGGYYVSMAVGEQERSIFAEPTTTTGSIGVIVPHYDISELMSTYHIKNDSIVSHPRKNMMSMTREINEEERKLMQSYVNESFERFKKIILDARPALRNDENRLEHQGRDLATGEIFSAAKALEFGLVDELGFIEEAIERVAELAGLSAEEVRVVDYERPPSLLGSLSGQLRGPAHGASFSLAELLQQSAPQAYYLSSMMPPLLSTYRPIP